MVDEQLLTLARQKDLGALRQVIDQALQPESVQVCDLGFRRDCLQISLEATQIPQQTVVVPIVQQAIGRLQMTTIEHIEVYGHLVGDELPHWMEQTQPVAPASPSPKPPVSSAPARPSLDIPASRAATPPETASAPVIERDPAIAKLIQDYEAGNRHFQKVNFSEMNLQGINLTLANLQEAQLVWANLSRASLGHTNLTSAKLRHANLSQANLQGANLQGAELQGANLQGANLSWAELRGVNFTGADLTDANLLNANLERVTMPDGTYLD